MGGVEGRGGRPFRISETPVSASLLSSETRIYSSLVVVTEETRRAVVVRRNEERGEATGMRRAHTGLKQGLGVEVHLGLGR